MSAPSDDVDPEDDDQVEDEVDETEEDEPCEADADDFVAGELQKRLWLQSTLPYLQLATPDALGEVEARSFARMRSAAAERAARIFRSDM